MPEETMTERRTPLSIVFVVPSLHGGGAEFVARTWMGWLQGQGHAVTVITTSNKSTDEHLPPGVKARSVAGERGQWGKSAAVRAIFRELKPDVAVALQAHANLILIAAARMMSKSTRPPILISERNLVSLGLDGASRSHRLKIWTARRTYRFADHVIAISHPVAGELVSGFNVSGSRCTVVPNPATAKVTAKNHVTRVPGSSRGIQIVLPCRLVRQKRPELAILAAAALGRRGVEAEVISFGGGPLLGMVESVATRENVTFTNMGWVEDWFDHFADNSVVVLPSDREGFGNVLVEAAAAGVPSVAVSGALGVADAVVAGITGELSLTADPESIADAILRACELPVDNIDSWLARFSIERSGADLQSVLYSTIDRARG
jgi:glycosyltransferase involved in cell wall biosynthesis